MKDKKKWDELGPINIEELDQLFSQDKESIAYQILERVPLQIFLKESAISETKGVKTRKYVWMNRVSRNLLGWSEEEVRRKYDFEAFSSIEDFDRMLRTETKSLKDGYAVSREIPWPIASDSDDAKFQLSLTREVPVKMAGNNVGYLSIVENHQWNSYRSVVEGMRNYMRHETKNFNRSSKTSIDLILDEISKLNVDEDNFQNDFIDFHSKVQAISTELKGQLDSDEKVSKILFNALSPTTKPESGSVLQVVKIVTDAFNALIDVDIKFVNHSQKEIRGVLIYRIEPVIALLTEGIRNAIKHSTLVNALDKKKIELSVQLIRKGRPKIIWEIINLSSSPKRLDFQLDMSFMGSSTEASSKEILKHILRSWYPTKTKKSNDLYSLKRRREKVVTTIITRDFK